MDLLDTQLFQLIGEEPLTRLIASFYKRIPSDEILGPLYPKEDLAGAQQPPREFVIHPFGGPETYSRTRGPPPLRMRPAPFPINERARDRWIQLMEQAIEEAALPANALPPLRAFFNDAATFLINR